MSIMSSHLIVFVALQPVGIVSQPCLKLHHLTSRNERRITGRHKLPNGDSFRAPEQIDESREIQLTIWDLWRKQFLLSRESGG